MLWVKAFHIISMVAWFSGLFYLPRLYVYHAQASDTISIERFKIMKKIILLHHDARRYTHVWCSASGCSASICKLICTWSGCT